MGQAKEPTYCWHKELANKLIDEFGGNLILKSRLYFEVLSTSKVNTYILYRKHIGL